MTEIKVNKDGKLSNELYEEIPAKELAIARIVELKSLLSKSDYKVLKHYEGELPEEEWATAKAERQAWRDEINSLQETHSIISELKPGQIIIEREWAMPSKNTFEIKPIHKLIMEEKTDGLWIDPFANKNKIATITNDLNPEFNTDYHLDALDFLKSFEDSSVDGVFYDPPYSPRQVSECYNDVGYNVTWDTTKASFWTKHKAEISRIVKPGGKVLTFGWNSGGIGIKYGFSITRILLVAHGGWHNDTICTVEIKNRKPVDEKM